MKKTLWIIGHVGSEDYIRCYFADSLDYEIVKKAQASTWNTEEEAIEAFKDIGLDETKWGTAVLVA